MSQLKKIREKLAQSEYIAHTLTNIVAEMVRRNAGSILMSKEIIEQDVSVFIVIEHTDDEAVLEVKLANQEQRAIMRSHSRRPEDSQVN